MGFPGPQVLMNKLGLPVDDSAREVREELLTGSGAVMAERCAIFMESGNVKEQQIVVARSPGSGEAPERALYDVNHFAEAWQRFVEWRQP